MIIKVCKYRHIPIIIIILIVWLPDKFTLKLWTEVISFFTNAKSKHFHLKLSSYA